MWLNLIQFMVYLNDSTACNAVVAIGDKNKGVIVVRPEHHPVLDDIKTLIRSNIVGADPKVLWGDGFLVDTWDNAIREYKEESVTDFEVVFDPSLPLLIPKSQAAHEWVKNNVEVSPWQSHSRIAVEPRYLEDLLQGIKDAGFTLEQS